MDKVQLRSQYFCSISTKGDKRRCGFLGRLKSILPATKFLWLGGDTQSVIDDPRFCHGDNGTQEFYETIIASQRLLLGLLKNHGEDIWIAYVSHGQAIRTLTGCSHRADGKLDAEPLYGMPNDPQALAEGLVRLWREHGERMVFLPCTGISEQEGLCA